MKKGGGIIILEGADCSGKSTLAKAIVGSVVDDGGDALYLHGRPWVGTVRREHVRMMIQARDAAHHGSIVVMDHFWVAEQLYGAEYRGGAAYDPTMIDQVMRDLCAQLVMCVPSNSTLQAKRHAERRKLGKEEFDKASGIIGRYASAMNGRYKTGSAYIDEMKVPIFCNRDDVIHYDIDTATINISGDSCVVTIGGGTAIFAANLVALVRRDFEGAYGRER